MSTQSLSTTPAAPPSLTRLRGSGLLFSRLAWFVMALVALGLFIGGIPLRAENLRGQYQPALGVNLSLDQSNNILVSPWMGYPATQAGILEGDILMAVNGVAPQVAAGQSLEDIIPSGAAGTPITLLVRTGDHPPRQYTVYLGGQDPLALAQLGLSAEFIAIYAVAIEIVFVIVCLGIALLILVRKSNDWLALLATLTFMLILFGLSEHAVAVYNSQPMWRPILDRWFALLLFVLLLFFCLFPDGQFTPRWTLAIVGLGLAWLLTQWLNPQLYPWKMRSLQLGFGIIGAWLLVGVIVLIYRYRYHSKPAQRQQTKWVVFGMTAAVLGLMGQVIPIVWPLPMGLPNLLFNQIGYPVIQFLKLLLPLTIAVAILRHRLWDIDFLLNRALVYGTLSAIVVGLYVIVVGALGTTIQGSGNLLISILATGLVAVLVQPMRDRLQRGVNRLMYGERDDPVTVLSRLGQRLEATISPDAVLPALVETIAQTLKLPYAAITWGARVDGEVAAAHGHPIGELAHLPLSHQGEIIGQLVVAPRASGEAFSSADHHLLENIAHQAGMAVHAVSLTVDLQRSRQRLVTTREEERRRLRRDLHDGLGPALASQGLTLAAAKQLLKHDPAAVERLLDDVIAQTQETVGDVRRLVYGLRPPALDERGLAEAIRDHIAHTINSGLLVEVSELPADLPPLPAAVDVAAYRIALEALTNVIRHARARYCLIRFKLNGAEHAPALQMEISDDGDGLPVELRVGVGLRSMRERAEELGGSLTIEPGPEGGTRVIAMLPVGDGTMAT